jgi:hypothetical protein
MSKRKKRKSHQVYEIILGFRKFIIIFLIKKIKLIENGILIKNLGEKIGTSSKL